MLNRYVVKYVKSRRSRPKHGKGRVGDGLVDKQLDNIKFELKKSFEEEIGPKGQIEGDSQVYHTFDLIKST